MPDKDTNLFSDIPGLDNPNGLTDFLNAQTQPAQEPGVPALTQPNATPATPVSGVETGAPSNEPAPQTFTQEQVVQIIKNLQASQAQVKQPVQPAQPEVPNAANPAQ